MARRFGKEDADKLVGAARTGDALALQEIAGQGVPVDTRSTHKLTALYVACAKGHAAAAQALLDAGANPNQIVVPAPAVRREYGDISTPLTHAITNLDIPLINLLLDRGANPAIVDIYCNTAAHQLLAQWNGLRTRDEGESLLNRTLGRMLELGAPIDQAGRHNDTLLHLAIDLRAPISTCRLLLDRGAHVARINSIGEQPIHRAARAGSASLVEMLVSAGAKVDALNWSDETPLFVFVGEDTGQALLDLGANKEWTDINGSTALGARVKVTPIHGAAVGEIAFLLRSGLDPDEKDYTGVSARDAARLRNLSTVESLFSASTARHIVPLRATDTATLGPKP